MAKNRKTVLKPFTYLQCDEFAEYLSKMAAKGWHFKEWSMGLVFEKGEPEQAVYAVEVFFKGSQYSMAPDVETLDFADFCAAAGWKLIDSRQKFCIFKQTRADAVPIVTPQERLENACKPYHKQLLGQLLIALLWVVHLALRLFPMNQFINSAFSNTVLLSCALFAFFFLYYFGKYIWFWCWKYGSKRRCEDGQRDFLRNRGDQIWNRISICALCLFTLAYAFTVELWLFGIFLGVIAAMILLALALSKLRPDKETNVGIQLLFTFLVLFGVMIVSFSQFSQYDKEDKPQTAPLTLADLGQDAGEITSMHAYEDSSILGSKRDYFLYYKDASLIYEIVDTQHDWLLELIWKDHVQVESTIHGSVIDCTALWDAEAAFYNGRDYYVRYEDRILIFRFLKFELSPAQVSMILSVLETGG